MSEPKQNDNKIEQDEHDDDFSMKKCIVYGWDGTQPVKVQVQADGTLVTV